MKKVSADSRIVIISVLVLVLVLSLAAYTAAYSVIFTINLDSTSAVSTWSTTLLKCNDYDCKTYLPDIYSKTVSSGTPHTYDVTSSGDFARFEYGSCVSPKIYFDSFEENPQFTTTSSVITLKTKQNCRATIPSLSIPQTIKEGDQVSIGSGVTSAYFYGIVKDMNTLTSLDSAIKDYYSSNTNTSIVVRKQDSLGEIVFSDNNQQKILANTTANIGFGWKPSDNGTFFVEVKTKVIDCACDQSTTQERARNITISVEDTNPQVEFKAIDTSDNQERYSGVEPFNVKFVPTVNSPDSQLTYEWDFNNDGVVDRTEASPTYQFAQDGPYTVRLRVKDKDSYTEATKQITVIDSSPPRVVFSPDSISGAEPFKVTFTDSSDASPDVITGWHWNFGDGTVLDYNTKRPTVDHAFNTTLPSKTYTVTLTATKTGGISNPNSVDITVSDSKPTASFSVSANPKENSPVTFTDTSTTPKDQITSWSWNFGDGNTSTLQNPTNTYSLNGTKSVTLTVTDSDGSTDTKTLQVPIGFVNDKPVIVGTIPNINKDEDFGTHKLDLTQFEFDEEDGGPSDNNNLTWSVSGVDGIAFTASVNQNTDELILTSVSNKSAVDTITLKLADSLGDFSTQDITVTVNPVNDPPVFVPSIAVQPWNEDSSRTVNIKNNFFDVEGFAGYIASPVQNLQVSINNVTGDVTFTPDQNFFGTRSVIFTAQDTGGLTVSSAPVTLTVNAQPEIDQLSSVSGSTVDPNSTISASTVSSSNLTNSTVSSSTVTGSSLLNSTVASNSTVLASTLSNSTVTSNSVVQNSNLTNVILINSTVINTVLENVTLENVYINPSTVKNSVIRNSTVRNSTVLDSTVTNSLIHNMTVTGANVNNNNLLSGTILFDGLTYNQPISLAYIYDRKPVFVQTIPSISWNEDTLYNLLNLKNYFTDADLDTLTFTKTVVSNISVNIDQNTGVVTFTPEGNFTGTRSVTFTATDPLGKSASSNLVSLIVNNTNDKPFVTSSPITSAIEDQLYQYDVEALDIDVGDVLTFSLLVKPVNMTINSSTGLISWTPDNSQVGANSVSVKISDSNGGTIQQNFTITVNNTNDAPIFTSSPITSATEDQLYQYDVDAFDMDVGDVLTFSLVEDEGPRPPITINSSTGLITWTPDNTWVGNNSVSVQVSDGNGGIAHQNFTITVANTNDVPVWKAKFPDFYVPEDDRFAGFTYPEIFNIGAAGFVSDVDVGDSLGFSIIQNNTQDVNCFLNSALLKCLSIENRSGVNKIVFNVTDGKVEAQANPIEIVNPIANIAVYLANNKTQQLNQSTTFNFTSHCTQTAAGSYSCSYNNEALFTNSGQYWAYVIYNNQTAGQMPLMIKLMEFNGVNVPKISFELNRTYKPNEAIVAITPVNDGPFVATNIPDVQFDEDGFNSSLNLTNFFGDIDSSSLVYTTTGASNLTVNISGSSVNITADQNFNGQRTLTFTASDGELNVSDTIIVTVKPVNDKPILLSQIPNQTWEEDTNHTLDVTPFFFDIEGGLTTTFSIQHPENISVSSSGNIFTFYPPKNFNGVNSISITAYDVEGEYVSSNTFYLNVTPVNDAASVILLDPVGGEILNGQVKQIKWNATDIDNDTLPIWIYYSNNSGTNWNQIAIAEENDGVFDWNITGIPSGENFRVLVTTFDGTTTSLSSSNSDFSIDNSKPVVNFVSPTPNSGSYNSIKTVNVAATDAHPRNINITVDGIVANTCTFSEACTYLLTDGNHSVYAVASDIFSQASSTETKNILIDTVNPSVRFSNPTPESGSYSSNQTINVTAEDINFNTIRLVVDGSEVSASQASPLLYILTEGNHTVQAFVNDTVGNSNQTGVRSITVDLTDPQIAFANPTPIDASVVGGLQSQQTINVTATDTNLKNITIFVDNIPKKTCNSSPCKFGWNTTQFADGQHNTSSIAFDMVGRSTSSEVRLVTVDNSAPQITLLSPAYGFTDNSHSQDFLFSATDQFAEVACELRISNSFQSYISSGLNNSVSTNQNTTIINTSIPDGVNYWYVACGDALGNINESAVNSRSLYKDYTLPNVTSADLSGTGPIISLGLGGSISPANSDGKFDLASLRINVSEEIDFYQSLIEIINSTGSVVSNTTADTIEYYHDGIAPRTSLVKYWNGTKSSSPTAFVPDGTYTINLTLTDTKGNRMTGRLELEDLEGTNPVLIVVDNAPPQFPVQEMSVVEGQKNLYNATYALLSDSNGVSVNTSSIVWDFGDGTVERGLYANHTYSQNGTYTLRLNITDRAWNRGSNTTLITVNDTMPTSNFTFSPDSGLMENITEITFTPIVSGYDQPLSLFWDFGDGTNSTQTNPTHVYVLNDNYTAKLTITDADGSQSIMSRNILVLDNSPIADILSTPGDEGDTIYFYGYNSTSNPDPIVSYFWNFGDGTNSTGVNTNHIYLDNGTYTITLTVTDSDGSQNSDTLQRTLSDKSPSANFTINPTNPNEDNVVQFTDVSTTPADTITNWLWSFGDGINSTLQNATHAYANISGIFSVRLIVTDDDGSTNSLTRNITVNPVNDAPFLATNIPDVQFNEDKFNSSLVLSNFFGDIDNTTLVYSTAGAANLTVNIAGSLVNITADQNFYGSRSLTFTASDGEFNVSDTITVTVNPVNDLPQIDSLTFENPTLSYNQFVGGSVDVKSTASDPSDPAGTISKVDFEYSTDSTNGIDGNWFTILNDTLSPFQKLGWVAEPQGSTDPLVWVRAIATDDLGGRSAYFAKNISVDNQAPNTTHNYNNQWKTSNVIVNLTADDFGGSGISDISYEVNSDGFTKSVASDGQPLITTEGSDNNITFYSTDNLGQTESTKTLTGIKLDKTNPVIQNLAVSNSNITEDSTGNYVVNVTVSDAVSGLAQKIITYRIGSQSPVTENLTLVSGSNYTFTIPEPAQTWDFFRGGNLTFNITAVDYSGRSTTVITTDLIDDINDLPSVALLEIENQPPAYRFLPVSITIKANASDSGDQAGSSASAGTIQNVVFEYSVNSTTGSDGTFQQCSGSSSNSTSNYTKSCDSILTTGQEDNSIWIRVRSQDNNGGFSGYSIQEIAIDSKAPVTVDNITREWFNSSISVNLSATDAGSGLNKTLWCKDTSNTCPPNKDFSTNPISVSTEGVTYLRYKSLDNTSPQNQEATKNKTIKLDLTLPGINFVGVSDNYVKNNTPVVLTVNATDPTSSGVSSGISYVTADGANLTSQGSGIFTKTINLTTSPVQIAVFDVAGNVRLQSFSSFTIDDTPPVINSVGLTDNITRNNTQVTVTVNVTEASIANVTAEGVLLTPQGSGIFTGLINLTDSPVEVLVFDNADNQAFNNTVIFVIDDISPKINSASLSDSYVKNNTEVVVTVNATDQNIKSVKAEGLPLNNQGNGLWNRTINLTTGMGSTVDIVVDDEADNQNTTGILFTIDDVQPAINSVGLSDNYVKNNTEVVVTVNLTEQNISTVTADGVLLDNQGSGIFNKSINLTGSTEGAFNLTVVATDAAGNVRTDSLTTYTIDDTKPRIDTLSITGHNNFVFSPANLDGLFDNVTVSLFASEAVNSVEGTITIHVFNSTVNFITLFPPSPTDFPQNRSFSTMWNGKIIFEGTFVPDGLYILNTTLTDNAGNSNTTNLTTIEIDNSNPSVNFVSPTPASGEYNSNQTINVTSSDAHPQNITIVVDNSVVKACPASVACEYSLTYGNHTVYATANDTVGNNATTEVRNILVDDRKPQIMFTFPTPSDGSVKRGNQIVSVQSSDDNFRNITIYLNSTVLFNCNPLETSCSAPWSTALSQDSTHALYAVATDLVGNTNTTEIRNVTTDNSRPQIEFVTPTAGIYTSQQTVKITASDAHLSTIVLKNGSTVLNSTTSTELLYTLTDGNWTLQATANDTVGNPANSTSPVRNILVDTLLPSVEFAPSSTANLSVVNGSSFVAAFKISDVNIANTTIKVNGSTANVCYSTSTCSFSGFVANDGNYTVYAITVDIAGNTNTSAIRIITVDNTKPTIGFISPTPVNGNYSADQMTNVSVSDNNLDTVWIVVDGMTVASGTGNTIGYLLEEGIHTFQAFVNDTVSHTNQTETRQIVVDKTNPQVYSASPVPSVVSGVISVNFTATDNIALKNITIFLNNTERTSCNSNFCTFEWNTTQFADGWYSINATTFDFAGRTNSTEILSVEVDNTAPQITLLSLANNSLSNKTTQNFVFNVTDDFVNVNCDLYISNNGGDWVVSGSDINAATYANTTITNTSVPEGTNYWFVRCSDYLGNTGDSAIGVLTTDYTLPTLTSISLTGHNGNYVFSPANLDGLYDNLSISMAVSEKVNFGYTRIINSTGSTIENFSGPSNSNSTIKLWNGTDGVDPVPDGLYNITTKITDLAGNVNDNVFVGQIYVDNSPPEFSVNVAGALAESELGLFNGTNALTSDVGAAGVDQSTYLWDFGDGNTSTEIEATNRYLQNNTYTVRLNITDLAGNKGSNTTILLVTDLSPSANFIVSPPPYFEGLTNVSFSDLSISYPDSIISRLWDFGDGTNSTDKNAYHVFGANKTYTVTLKVTDSDNSTSTSNTTIEVLDAKPFVLLTGTIEMSEGQTGFFTAYVITFFDALTQFEWDFDFNGTFSADQNTGTLNSTNSTFNANGTYTVTVKVTDSDNSTSFANLTLNVTDLAPTAVISGPSSVFQGKPTIFDITGSSFYQDPIVLFEWDFNYSASLGFNATPGLNATSINYTFQNPGTQTIALRLTDSDNSTSIAIKPVLVNESVHDLAVTSIAYNKSASTVYLYDRVLVSANISNFGSFGENSFTVEFRTNGDVLETRTESLAFGQTKEVSFVWIPNVTGFKSPTIKIVQVPGEINTVNNQKTIQNIKVYSAANSVNLQFVDPSAYPVPTGSGTEPSSSTFFVWAKVSSNITENIRDLAMTVGTNGLTINTNQDSTTSPSKNYPIFNGTKTFWWELNSGSASTKNMTVTVGNPGDQKVISRLVDIV